MTDSNGVCKLFAFRRVIIPENLSPGVREISKRFVLPGVDAAERLVGRVVPEEVCKVAVMLPSI